MAKPRVTATNRLADVIEVVELGRRTGMLMAERGAGEMLEEGTIYFHGGRAIYAAVERIFGQDALAVLGGWGGCRFAFDPDAPRPAQNLALQQPARSAPTGQDPWASSTAGYYAPPSRAPQSGGTNARGWPAPSQGSPTPPSGPLSQPTMPQGGRNDANWPDSWPRPGAPGTNPGTPPPPAGWTQPNAPISGPMPQMPPQQARTTPNRPAPPPQGTYPTSGPANQPGQRPTAHPDGALLRRPRRAPTVRDLLAVVQTYNLSRAHRTLLMLADGEHNVIDLARLSSKQIEEVVSLLRDLEGHGLIYYY